MGDIEETNLPTWTKLSGSIVSLFVTKITHACSLLLFQNSFSSWNNYITKAQMVFYCYWHHSPISLASTKTLFSTVCDTQMYWCVCTFTHGHRCIYTQTRSPKAGYVLQILFSFSYFKGHYLADLKKLKRKVGSAQLQRLFLTRLTFTEACHHKPVTSKWQPTTAQTEEVAALPWACSGVKPEEACEWHRVELCPLRHQRVLEAAAPSLCFPSMFSWTVVCEEEKHIDN